MAARVDDARVRQDRVDEPYVTEVIGELVREVLAPRAQRRGLLQVTTAECAEEPGRGAAHALGVAIAVGRHVFELVRDVDDVRQLHGAFHARVAGEDLLHQRGAGARQADDEDRRAARVAPAGTPGKELRIEERPNARAAALEVLDVEWRIQAPQRVALGVVRECLRILAGAARKPSRAQNTAAPHWSAHAYPLASRRCMAATSASLKT